MHWFRVALARMRGRKEALVFFASKYLWLLCCLLSGKVTEGCSVTDCYKSRVGSSQYRQHPLGPRPKEIEHVLDHQSGSDAAAD